MVRSPSSPLPLSHLANPPHPPPAVPGPPSTSLTSSDLGLTSDLPSSIIPLPPTLTLPPGSKPPPKKPPPPLLELKLGLPVLDPKLEKEVGRVLKDDYTPSVVEGGVTKEEGLPYPSTLRTVDVVREVERVREGRKRIKLGTGTGEEGGEGGAGAKPSVCLFTVHDAGESFVFFISFSGDPLSKAYERERQNRLITVTFSEDSSLMAAGFSESYIRLWNLKGEPLVSKTSDNNGEGTFFLSHSYQKLSMYHSPSDNPTPDLPKTNRPLWAHLLPLLRPSPGSLPPPKISSIQLSGLDNPPMVLGDIHMFSSL